MKIQIRKLSNQTIANYKNPADMCGEGTVTGKMGITLLYA